MLLHGPLAIDDQGRTVCPEAGRRAHDAALRIAFLHCSGIAHPVLPLSYFVAGRYLQFEGTVAKSDVQEPLTLIKRSLVASARIHPVAGTSDPISKANTRTISLHASLTRRTYITPTASTSWNHI